LIINVIKIQFLSKSNNPSKKELTPFDVSSES